MSTIGHVIDLDKYECKSSLIGLDGAEDNNNHLQDYQSLGIEIVDYGISEEQEEVEEMNEATEEQYIARMEFPEENRLKGSSVCATDLITSCKIKPAHVKLVDCDRFPWYYAKYKKQILKRICQNALEQARSIIKYIKDEDIINVDEISEEENEPEKYLKTAPKQKTIAVEKQWDHKTSLVRNVETQKFSCTGIKTKCTNDSIDIKKNKGLVGMKIQTICSEKIKEKIPLKKKVIDIRTHVKAQKSDLFDMRNNESNLKEPKRVSISLPKVKTKENKKKMEKMNFYCTDVLKDLKHIKQPENDRSISKLPADTVNICDVDHKNTKHLKKYKPMPKSKKIELAQQLNQVKNYSNMLTKLEKCSKGSRKHIATPKMSFPITNQLTGKILKKLYLSTKYKDINNDKSTIKRTPYIPDKPKKLIMINCDNKIDTDKSLSIAPTSSLINVNNTEYPITSPVVPVDANNTKFLQHKNTNPIGTDAKNENTPKSIPSTKTLTLNACEINKLPTDVNKDSGENKKTISELSNSVANQHPKKSGAQNPSNKNKPDYEYPYHDVQQHTESDISAKDKCPSETPEYIVPDLVKPSQIQCTTYGNTSLPDSGLKIGFAYASAQPQHGPVHIFTSLPQQSKPVQNNTEEFINISIMEQTDRNSKIIPINSQISVIMRPRVSAITEARPNLYKRSPQAMASTCDPRIQQGSANITAIRHYNIPSPNFARPPLRNVPPWVNQYRNPNYRYPNPNYRYPPNMSVQRLPQNAFNQQPIFNSNYQNNYHQPMWYGNYNNMSYETRMPPGICNIGQFPLSPRYQNSSIIGQNNTGLVKKINIKNPKTTQKNNEEHNKNDDKTSMNDTHPVSNAASIYTHTKQNQEKVNKEIIWLNKAPVMTKSEMLKELAKSLTNFEDGKNVGREMVKLPLESQAYKQTGKQTENQLVKQLPLPDTSEVLTNQSQAQKQDLKRPLSASAEPEFSKSQLPAHKPVDKKHIETAKGQKIQNLSSQVTDAIVNIPLPDKPKTLLAKSEDLKVNNNNLKRPISTDPRAEKTNNVKKYRPGPLSKRMKPSGCFLSPSRDPNKLPSGNGYTSPIPPITTFHNFLTDLEEFHDSSKTTENDSASSQIEVPEIKKSEDKKKPLKSILRNKSNTTPELAKKSTIKKISIEEYIKRSSKERKEKHTTKNTCS